MKFKFIVRFSVSFLLIFYIGIKINWSDIIAALLDVDFRVYMISVFFTIPGPIIIAYKYNILIKGTSLALSIQRLIVINYITRFFSLFLPSALGPEVVRWYKITRNKQGRSFFLAATIFERITFIFVLLLIGVIALYVNTYNREVLLLKKQFLPLIVTAFIFIAGAMAFFISPKIQYIIKITLKRLFQLKEESKIYQFLDNFALKDSFFPLFFKLCALSILWHSFFTLRIFYLFKTMDVQLQIFDIIWMGSFVLLLQILPVSLAGIGIREGAYAYLFTLYNLPSEKGVLIGLLFFSQMLILAFLGAIFNFFEK